MNFLLLTIQSVVCVTCVFISKRLGVRLPYPSTLLTPA